MKMKKNLILALVLIIAISNAQNFQSYSIPSYTGDKMGSNVFEIKQGNSFGQSLSSAQSNLQQNEFRQQSNFQALPQQTIQTIYTSSPQINFMQGSQNLISTSSQPTQSIFPTLSSTANQNTDPIIKISKVTGVSYIPPPTTNKLFLRGQSDVQVSNGPQPLQLLISGDKLQVLINNNKVKQLLTIIQNVATSTIKCQTKNAYLNDLLAKVQIGVQVKKFSIDNLKLLIQGSQAQFDQLKIDNKKLDQQQKDLKLTDLYAQYDSLLAKLKSAESQYKACNADNQKSAANELKNQYSNLDIKLKNLISSLKANNDSIVKTDSDIQNLQLQIIQLKQKKIALQNNDPTIRNSISQTQSAMSQLKDRISVIDLKISDILAKCNQLRKVFQDFLSNLNSLKLVVTSTQNKFKQLDRKIVVNNNAMDKLSKDAQSYDAKIKDNQNSISEFSKYVEDMKDVVHFNYFKCNNVIDMTITRKTVDSQATFKFGLMSYTAYLNKAYTIGTGSMIPIDVTPSTIFSKSFVDAYGFGFTKEILAAAKKVDSPSLTLDTDFSCLATFKDVAVRRGVIKSVSNRIIQVTNDDLTVSKLILGTCSRFDGTGINILPKIGSKIAFKGARVNDNIIVHSISLL